MPTLMAELREAHGHAVQQQPFPRDRRARDKEDRRQRHQQKTHPGQQKRRHTL